MGTGMEKYTELQKYPVTVFSILLALIAAKFALGIRFGTVSEVGPGGIKFAQEANAKIADLEGRLNGVLVELESLKKRTPLVNAEKKRIAAKAFEANQEISDQTARLAGAGVGKGADRQVVKGYIWIGNFKETWGRTTLGSPDTGQPISLAARHGVHDARQHGRAEGIAGERRGVFRGTARRGRGGAGDQDQGSIGPDGDQPRIRRTVLGGDRNGAINDTGTPRSPVVAPPQGSFDTAASFGPPEGDNQQNPASFY